MRHLRSTVAAVALVCVVSLQAATPEELRAEIRDLKGKIAETKKLVKQTRGTTAGDAEAYRDYRAKHTTHLSAQRAEVDSLKRTHGRLQKQADSLARSIRTVRARQKEQSRLQDDMARQLAQYCDSLTDVVEALPPGNVRAQLGALAFLRSELAGKSVDNVEAFERLWEIMNALASSAQAIEVYAGPSPVPAIVGQVDFVRLGHAYLAVVNEKGSAGALWEPGTGSWKPINDPDQLGALRKCVRIRQGGAVPQLVDLPFAHSIGADTLSQEGGDR